MRFSEAGPRTSLRQDQDQIQGQDPGPDPGPDTQISGTQIPDISDLSILLDKSVHTAV